jgi:hypothetical protein
MLQIAQFLSVKEISEFYILAPRGAALTSFFIRADPERRFDNEPSPIVIETLATLSLLSKALATRSLSDTSEVRTIFE